MLEVQAGLAECLLLEGDVAGARSLADETIAQAQALGGVAPQIPALLRVRGAALAISGDEAGARESLRQSLQAAEVREAEYETALTLRVLAALEADPGEREVLARSAEPILAKLEVEWTPNLLAATPGGPLAAVAPPAGRSPVHSAAPLD